MGRDTWQQSIDADRAGKHSTIIYLDAIRHTLDTFGEQAHLLVVSANVVAAAVENVPSVSQPAVCTAYSQNFMLPEAHAVIFMKRFESWWYRTFAEAEIAIQIRLPAVWRGVWTVWRYAFGDSPTLAGIAKDGVSLETSVLSVISYRELLCIRLYSATTWK
jgi:hypothetical protein